MGRNFKIIATSIVKLFHLLFTHLIWYCEWILWNRPIKFPNSTNSHSPQRIIQSIWAQVLRISFNYYLIVNLIIVQFLTINYYFVWLTRADILWVSGSFCAWLCTFIKRNFAADDSQRLFFAIDNSKNWPKKMFREKLTAQTAPTMQTFSKLTTDWKTTDEKHSAELWIY